MYERFHREQKIEDEHKEIVNWEETYVPLDSMHWRRPRILTLQKLGEVLTVEFNDDIVKDRNVTSLNVNDVSVFEPSPPSPDAEVVRSFIAVDKNYMYVWVPQAQRWKRVALSSF